MKHRRRRYSNTQQQKPCIMQTPCFCEQPPHAVPTDPLSPHGDVQLGGCQQVPGPAGHVKVVGDGLAKQQRAQLAQPVLRGRKTKQLDDTSSMSGERRQDSCRKASGHLKALHGLAWPGMASHGMTWQLMAWRGRHGMAAMGPIMHCSCGATANGQPTLSTAAAATIGIHWCYFCFAR